MTGAPPGLLLAGEIGKPHGLTGEVYVVPISDDPHRFDAGAKLLHGDGRELVVASSRRHRNRLLATFEGVETRAGAEGLRGPLYVGPEALRDLDEGEFWTHELTGCKVLLPDGSEVGEVDSVSAGAAHDLLVVRGGFGEALVPVVKEIVVGIDLQARCVTIDPPEGLLEAP